MMEVIIDKKTFQTVMCIQDNKSYLYNVEENPCFIESDYVIIKCFLIEKDGIPDFSKEIEIYGKYLVSSY